jgi:hypothetical protein
VLRASGSPDTTSDEPRVSSLILGASCIRDPRDHAPYSTLRTCRVRYFEHWRVRFDERRGIQIIPGVAVSARIVLREYTAEDEAMDAKRGKRAK